MKGNVWKKIEFKEGTFEPVPRSGHAAVVKGNKMFIFGGIFEITKELNDMIVYDFTTQVFDTLENI